MKTVEEKITAWIDGRLEGKELADFERQLEPKLIAEKQEAQELGDLLRSTLNAPGAGGAAIGACGFL